MDRPTDEGLDVEAVKAGIMEELELRRRHRVPGAAPTWWSAAQIAERFGIRPGGSIESKKRGVRNVIELLRVDHTNLIACGHGYALASDASELLEYADRRRRAGLTDLAAGSQARRDEVVVDASGQQRFF